jgi:hypothetical protein
VKVKVKVVGEARGSVAGKGERKSFILLGSRLRQLFRMIGECVNAKTLERLRMRPVERGILIAGKECRVV